MDWNVDSASVIVTKRVRVYPMSRKLSFEEMILTCAVPERMAHES